MGPGSAQQHFVLQRVRDDKAANYGACMTDHHHNHDEKPAQNGGWADTPSVCFADTSPAGGGGEVLRLRQALSSPAPRRRARILNCARSRTGGSTVPDLIRDGDGGEK